MTTPPEAPDPRLAVGTRVRDSEGFTGTVEFVTGNAPFKYLVRWDGDDSWGTTDWHAADVLEPVPGEAAP